MHFCQDFFPWYNGEHRHSDIGLLTPEMVHHGKAETVVGQRRIVLASAFQAHPERFVRGLPVPPPLPEAAWINKPKVASKEAGPAENVLVPGVSRYGSGGDRRSWGILEGNFSGRPAQVPENDTKFESEVSHYH